MKNFLTGLFFVCVLSCCVNASYYDAYNTDTAPDINEVNDVSYDNGLEVTTFWFLSRVDDGEDVLIYSIIARPNDVNADRPGMVCYHGGGGCADAMETFVRGWAEKGYVAICLDQPGICGSGHHSFGPWATSGSNYDVDPNATESRLYDGIVAGLNALALLRTQDDVDPNKIGVCGGSWGGYMTTIISGIAGDRVAASAATYGSGYYDIGSEWSPTLDTLSATDHNEWVTHLDPGRFSSGITSKFHSCPAANDWFFWPKAGMMTFNQITGEKNVAYAPNDSHAINIPGGTRSPNVSSKNRTYMELCWLRYHLEGVGNPFPECDANDTITKNGDYITVGFDITDVVGINAASVYYSYGEQPYRMRFWNKLTATQDAGDPNHYTADIPVYETEYPIDWFGLVSNTDTVSASTLVITTDPCDYSFAAGDRISEPYSEDFETATIGALARWDKPYAKSFGGSGAVTTASAHGGTKSLRMQNDYALRCDAVRGQMLKQDCRGLSFWTKSAGGTGFDVLLVGEEPNGTRVYWRNQQDDPGTGWTQVFLYFEDFDYYMSSTTLGQVASTTHVSTMEMLSSGLGQLRFSTLSGADVYIDDIGMFGFDFDISYRPTPANGAIEAAANSELSWIAGDSAVSHDVYFGTAFADVNTATTGSAEFMENTSSTSYNPGLLEANTTYYWRIDDVDGGTTYKGDVWSFTTGSVRSEPEAVDADMQAWWKMDAAGGSTLSDASGNSNTGTITGADFSPYGGKIAGALNFNGTSDYVSVSDFNYVGDDNDFTVSVWFKVSDLEGHSFEYLYSHDYYGNYPSLNLAVRGGNLSSPYRVKATFKYDDLTQWETIPVAEVNDGVWHMFTVTVSDTSGTRVYLDGASVASNSAGKGSINPSEPVYLGCRQGTGDFFGASGDDGMMDDVRVYSKALAATEIAEIYSQGCTAKAVEPIPADDETGVDVSTDLDWVGIAEATNHDVYMSTSLDTIENAVHDSSAYMGNFDANTFSPTILEYNTKYYWAVDEVNDNSIWFGDIWNFTTENDPNIKGLWLLNESDGNTASDATGNGHDGTLSGGTWRPELGIEGGALHFDGDDSVEISDFDYVSDSNEFSLCLWFKNDDASMGNHYFLFSHGSYVNNNSINVDLRADAAPPANQIKTFFYCNGTNWQPYSVGDYNDGQWHMYALTMSDTSGTNIYIDGIVMSSNSAVHGAFDPNADIYLGGYTGSSLYYGATDIDDALLDTVRIYDRELTADEIERLSLVKANGPIPADNRSDVSVEEALGWTAGRMVADDNGHELYLGTDYNSVTEANDADDEYIGALSAASYYPPSLKVNTSYYWAVDEVNSSNTWVGDIWTFTTTDEPNMLSWWRMDEGTGSSAYDSIDSNDLTVYDAVWTTSGKINGALDFNGVTDYAYTATVSEPRDAYTIMLWFNSDNAIDSTDTRADLLATSSGRDRPYLCFNKGATGRLYWCDRSYDNDDDRLRAPDILCTTSSWTADTWYHYAVTFDGSAWKIYIDGELEYTYNCPEACHTGEPTAISLGRKLNGNAFDGKIDDCKIYDYALDSDEIDAVYRAGL